MEREVGGAEASNVGGLEAGRSSMRRPMEIESLSRYGTALIGLGRQADKEVECHSFTLRCYEEFYLFSYIVRCKVGFIVLYIKQRYNISVPGVR